MVDLFILQQVYIFIKASGVTAEEVTNDDAVDQQKARIFISFKTNSSSRPHLIILIFQ